MYIKFIDTRKFTYILPLLTEYTHKIQLMFNGVQHKLVEAIRTTIH